MSFKSLHQLFNSLDHQDAWHTQRRFQKLLGCWFEVVGPVVAAHTRPLKIQRQVLQVATSSPAWAQNLVFERRRILEKLNTQLELQLTDIRFSSAHWHSDSAGAIAPDSATTTWQNHPSRVEGATISPPPAASSDPVEAFQAWSQRVRSQLQHLPLCPQCQCHTPPGELKRWSVCALCATKQWQRNS